MKNKKLDLDGKYRMWNLILYPDNEQHNEAIVKLLQEFNCVGICHSEDTKLNTDEDDILVDENGVSLCEGDKLKPHYHFIIKLVNPRYRSGLADELGINKYYFEPTGSWYGSAKYLLHIGHPEKYQYDTSDLVGSLASAVIKMIDDVPVEEIYKSILDWIDANKRYINMIALQRYCITQGYFSAMRSTYKLLSDYVNSHNSHYQDKQNEKEV